MHKKLANEEVLAIRVKGFLPEPLAVQLGDKILAPGFEGYINAPSIGRIGMAFYEAENQPLLIEDYFERATRNIAELRERCAPTPRRSIPCAACSTSPGRPALIWKTSMAARCMSACHGWSNPVCVPRSSRHFRQGRPGQLSGPQPGGAVRLQRVPEHADRGRCAADVDDDISPDRFDEMRGDSYGIDPALLGPPTLEVRPEPGDFIMFNSRCMHSVTPGVADPRLSLSFFVGYRGNASPLTFWS